MNSAANCEARWKSSRAAGSNPVALAKAAPPPAAPPASALPPAAKPDAQTEARLTRMEEDQQLLEGKVNDQYQTKVESASKYRVKLSGIALLNVFGNSGTVDNQDVPSLALLRGSTEHQRQCGRHGAAIGNWLGSLRTRVGWRPNQRQCEL